MSNVQSETTSDPESCSHKLQQQQQQQHPQQRIPLLSPKHLNNNLNTTTTSTPTIMKSSLLPSTTTSNSSLLPNNSNSSSHQFKEKENQEPSSSSPLVSASQHVHVHGGCNEDELGGILASLTLSPLMYKPTKKASVSVQRLFQSCIMSPQPQSQQQTQQQQQQQQQQQKQGPGKDNRKYRKKQDRLPHGFASPSEEGTTNMILTPHENVKRSRTTTSTMTMTTTTPIVNEEQLDESRHMEDETFTESEEEDEEGQFPIQKLTVPSSSTTELFSPMMVLNQSLSTTSTSSPSFQATYSTPRVPRRHQILLEDDELSTSIHSMSSSYSTSSSMDVPPTRMEFGTPTPTPVPSTIVDKTMTSYSSSSSPDTLTPRSSIANPNLLLRRRHELVGQDDDDDLSLESDDDRHYYLTSDEEYQEEEEDETDKEHDISQELNDEENELDEEEKLLYLYESGTESEDENEKGDDKRVQLPAGKAKIQDKIETAHIVNHDDSSDEDYEPVEVILLDETTDKDYDSDDEVSARSSIMKNILLDEVQTNLKSYREYNSLVSSSSSDGEEEQDDEMSHVNTSNHEADTQHQILEFVASPLNGRKPSTRKRRSRKHKMTQSIKRKSSSGDNRNMHEGEEYIRDTSNGGGHAIAKGKWSLGDRIGQGSFGVVHKGMNGRSGKLMAVKCLCIPSNQSSSFQDLVVDLEREIRLMKSFDHKNIVRYIGTEIDTEKHMLYIFQEWVPGGSVASLLKNFGPFPLGVIRTYLYQMVCGLEYLHSKQILHRDIKGGNILVNDEGIVKLADFGASKRIQVSENGTLMDIDDLMENMTFRGTPFFMAPEVFEEKYGPKADIWSCAGVAHQMSTGTPPWKDLGLRSQIPLFNHLKNSSGPPPMPKDDDQNSATPVSCQSFQNLLTQCFQRDPKKRPSTQVLLQHQFFRERDPNESILEDVSEAEYRCFSAEKKNYRHSRLNTPLSPVSPISPLKLLQLKRQEKTPHIPKVAGEISSGDWPSWAKEAAERKR